MHYVDFSSEVEPFVIVKKDQFRKEIYQQILHLNIKPKQYDDFFRFDDYKTNLDWGSAGLKSLVDNFRSNKGDINKAIAFYFMFHHVEPYFPAARNLDFYLFGDGAHIGSKFFDKGFGNLPSQRALMQGSSITSNQENPSFAKDNLHQSDLSEHKEASAATAEAGRGKRFRLHRFFKGVFIASPSWVSAFIVLIAIIGSFAAFKSLSRVSPNELGDSNGLSERVQLKIDVKATTVQVGDDLKFAISSNRKCEVQIFYITSEFGVRSFPPKLIGGSYLEPNKERSIPRSGWGTVQFTKPGNEEVLVVICRVGGLRGARLSVERAKQLLNEYQAITSAGMSQYLVEGTYLDIDPSKDIQFLELDDEVQSDLLGSIAIETVRFKVLPWQKGRE
ncbi:conserved hypothetical protein [Roseibium sp. TrichSKD4]|uniref:DUF4384 domain-containing protein n=1 Tax=Roseibium sp. TrichSKD4 TaxID=744980 RepID=UPI0001E56AF0|nr:hypothetical protein [Roseibium sp. TrichSKD4]EFO32568.1 conserved hypothetical protein [Roseibium sp. TrichSKD4]